MTDQFPLDPDPSRTEDGLCILLVEDNPGDADLIRARLRGGRGGNLDFLWAERLAEALETLRARPVDLVFLDLNLPDSTGIDTVTSVRQAAPSVPVVVLTGNEGSEIGLAAVQAGAQDFLVKGTARGDVLWRVARYAIERQRSQQRVRDSERFLQSSLDALSARVAILDEEGVALFVNRAWAESVGDRGGTPQAYLGTNYLATCDELAANGVPDAAELAAGARAVISGECKRFETECRHGPDGQKGWTLVRVTRFSGGGGARIAIAHEDITDLKTTQLREQRLARVLRGVRNVNQLITKTSDRQELIQGTCDALAEALSYGNAWIVLADETSERPLLGAAGLGPATAEFEDSLADRHWPECMARALAQPDVVKMPAGSDGCAACPLAGNSSGTRLVARLASQGHVFGAMAVSVPHGSGQSEEEETLFGELVEDVAFALHKMQLAAEHRTSQEALIQSEERYRTLFQDATVGIFETSLDGKALVVNPAMARILGFGSCEEAIEYYHDLARQLYVHADRRQEFVRLLRERGEVHEFEYEAQAADGRHLWLSMNARLAPALGDRPPHIEGFTTDITTRKEAEERMLESERMHRLLADNTVDCIWLMDTEGNLQYVNPACEALVGYTPDEIVGRNVREFCDDENYAIMQAAINGALGDSPARLAPVVFEGSLKRRDGTSVAVEITGRVVPDEAGRPRHLQGVARDITERRRAMEEIRSRENLLNKIFDTLPVGLWLADPNGQLYRSNEEGRRIWGCPPMVSVEEYGVFKARRLPSRTEIAPDDWALAHTVREKATVSNELLEIDAFDGEQRIILNSTSPVLNDEGEIEAAVVINLDVTELQQAQAERERLRLAIEQSQDIIVITDKCGAIQYVNPAFEKITGYGRSEALGRNPSLLKSGRQDAAFYAEVWRTISGGTTWRGRFVNRRKDGSLYTEEATISPVLDKSGGIINYVAVKRDITDQLRLEEERERLEEQVEHSQRLESIGRLAGGVAHDLNNLLSPILGYGELLMLDLQDNEGCRESVQEIVRAGERARRLVAQLLAFGRRQLLKFQPVNLNNVLANFENLLRRAIREDVEIQLFPAAHLPVVRADVGQLEQVVMNLAVNAQDAMPDGGCLTIETGLVELDQEYTSTHEEVTPGWHVLLCVSDTGTGMDEATRARVFEPFFTTKTQDKGTGLGLATVYGIVKQHNGSIWVYSEPNEGTTFKVYLPVDTEASGEIAQFTETPVRTGGAETILLAEDDEQVQGLARAVLRREGYTVLIAKNGEHALQIVTETDDPIDLLLTDVIMPDMNGRALYERLAAQQPGLKVLYMSGYTDNVIAHHGVLDAGLSFIQKPFNIHSLARKVREVLDN